MDDGALALTAGEAASLAVRGGLALPDELAAIVAARDLRRATAATAPAGRPAPTDDLGGGHAPRRRAAARRG